MPLHISLPEQLSEVTEVITKLFATFIVTFSNKCSDAALQTRERLHTNWLGKEYDEELGFHSVSVTCDCDYEPQTVQHHLRYQQLEISAPQLCASVTRRPYHVQTDNKE